MKKLQILFFALLCFGVGKGKAQSTVLLNFNGINGSTPYGSLTLSGSKFYGMTYYGGVYNTGEVFSMDTNGSTNTDLHNFYNDSLYGVSPYGNLTLSGGKFYGMTYSGGLKGYGNIFSIDTNGLNYKNLWNFDQGADTNGSKPPGSLILWGSKLYGMTVSGGINHAGNIFSIDTNGKEYKNLWNFDGGGDTNGSSPQGDLILSGGKLYGMTFYGGVNTRGNIFSIDTNGSNYKDLWDFNYYSSTGQYPLGDLTLVGNKFYGMTYSGGLKGYGVIYSIDTNGSDYNDLYSFNNIHGDANPFGSLIFSAGKLFGMTHGGVSYYGNIFSIDTNGSNYKDLWDFDNTNGAFPQGNIILAENKLYGMTGSGGTTGNGVIYSIDTNGANYNLLHSFGIGSDGVHPWGSFIMSGGELCGMASSGGVYNKGAIVSIDTNGNKYDKLYDFGKSSTNGANPFGSLILTGDKLYGMTQYGGINERGNIFSMDTNGTNYKDLLDFDTGITGEYPGYDLILSGNKLYGMTTNGGKYSYGNIFSIDTNGNSYKNLWNFDNIGTNGAIPYGDLIQSGGKLYGMTWRGGIYSDGNVFSIDTDGTGYKDLLDFNITNGENPAGSLILSRGKLYGMTQQGGLHGNGSIFSVDTNGTMYKDIFDFDGFNGSIEGFSLTLSLNKLYGMTSYGGFGDGNIFSIDTNGSEYNNMFDFNGSYGANPQGSLTLSGGYLYGMTSKGGANNDGVIFKIDTSAIASINNLGVIKGSINIFPNPSNGYFTLSLSNVNEKCSVEIYNMLGEKVYATCLPQTPKGSFKGFGVMYFNVSYYSLRFAIEAAFTDILHIKTLYAYLSLIDLYRGICTRLYKV